MINGATDLAQSAVQGLSGFPPTAAEKAANEESLAPAADGRSVALAQERLRNPGPFSSPICDGRFGIPAGGNV